MQCRLHTLPNSIIALVGKGMKVLFSLSCKSMRKRLVAYRHKSAFNRVLTSNLPSNLRRRLFNRFKIAQSFSFVTGMFSFVHSRMPPFKLTGL